ncbi:MAG: DUF3048 domain-containing protein [Chloroflexota bacterium]
MAPPTHPPSPPRRQGAIRLIGLALAILAVLVVWQVAAPLPSGNVTATSSPAEPSALPSADGSATAAQPTPTSAAQTAPPPTPIPTPRTVPAPLTGLPVSPEAALQHPIAVMVDDDVHARPQSGFNAASIVWQAPAEGGVPRYMMIFQDRIPDGVGPVRSARQYYVEWASEWRAMYVHHGGSPQALATLRAKGAGQWVYNADGFRWLGRFLSRTDDKFAPHNVYTDGERLRRLAVRLNVEDGEVTPIWSFGRALPAVFRPSGGTIKVVYPYEAITYRYDGPTNRYLRFIDKSTTPQVDGDDGQPVAPTNVVILRMAFGPLNDGHPETHRLEARDVGTGEAWVSTNGATVKAVWKKKSASAPTLLFGLDGKELTLTPGQTFVQVIPLTYAFKITAGTPSTWRPPVQVAP